MQARSVPASSSLRTKAEPTITPSAYDATSAAWSPWETPRPTHTGRSVTVRVRATNGPARSLLDSRAPVTPMTAVA